MRKPILVFLAVVYIVVAGCSQNDPTSKPSARIREAQTNAPAKDASVSTDKQPDSKGNRYTPPTAEEMAPMRPEYMAELAKIHEPPEMAGKPMHDRRQLDLPVDDK